MALKYYKELDGLRGIAALMILFFHFMPNASVAIHPVIYYIRAVAVFGQTGVTLFFVLSGFLITRILLSTKSHKHYFRNFYIKRALRIFPLYYLGLIFFYFVVPLITKQPLALNGSWIYWFYLQNITDTFLIPANGPQHFWSLAVEEHFYLFWPLLIYFVAIKNTPRLIASVVALAFVCRCVLIYFGYGTFYFTFSIMDALAIGAFLAWYENTPRLIKLNFNAIIIISLLLMLPTWVFVGGRGYDWVQLIKFPVIATFYMGIIGKVIYDRSWLNAVLLLPVLRFTGKISYGLYVFHPLCFMLFYWFFPDKNIWINTIGCFGLSYAVATISFYAFEKRFLKFKKYFEPAKWAKKQGLQFD